jgi:hypothetical protein
MVAEKLLDKLAKLRRHADSAKEIGNEAEAQAFAEMFQRLVVEHKVNVSDIEYSQLETEEPVGRHYINYQKHEIPLKRKRIDWVESLAGVVAQAHFCRILVTLGSSRITLVGRKSDCEVAEYVLVTLQRAAEKMAKKAYYKYWFELFEICSRCGGQKSSHSGSHEFVSSTSKAAGFKASWLEAFVSRLAQRYREQKQGYTGDSMALVRVNRAEKAVIEWMEETFGDKKSKAGALSGNRRWNSEGNRQGRAAADALDLGNPKAVKTTERKQVAG